MIKDLPMSALRDINIEIQDPKTVIKEVIEQTSGLSEITVLLCSDIYSFNECVQLINSTWQPEYSKYFKDNSIEFEIVNLKKSYELEETRKIKPIK